MTEPPPPRTLEDYRGMRLVRRFEERALELQSAGEISGSMHLCCGHEAIPVAACRSLAERDALTATYRGHGWAIARGVPITDLFAELMGRQSPLCGGRGGSAYLSSARHGFLGENSIVGAGVPIALGAAIAAARDGVGAVSLVSIGDGALNQGSVHEALNFAAVVAAPLVVVVENNVYSEMVPIRDMVRIDPLSARAAAYGMPGTTVEGRETAPVEAAVREAVQLARSGGGPSLVECLCDRIVGHYTGDVQHYRPRGELDEARAREPLVRLRAAFPMLAEQFDGVDREVDAEIEAAVTAARAVEPARTDQVHAHVYG